MQCNVILTFFHHKNNPSFLREASRLMTKPNTLQDHGNVWKLDSKLVQKTTNISATYPLFYGTWSGMIILCLTHNFFWGGTCYIHFLMIRFISHSVRRRKTLGTKSNLISSKFQKCQVSEQWIRWPSVNNEFVEFVDLLFVDLLLTSQWKTRYFINS